MTILLFCSVHAEIEDLTVQSDGTQITVSEVGVLQQLTKLDSKLTQIQTASQSCMQTSQFDQMNEQLNQSLDEKLVNFQVSTVITLLVFLAFAWATAFLMKSKGWI